MSSADRKGSVGTSGYWLHTWVRRYGLALVLVVVAALLRDGLSKLLGPNLPFLLFYPVIWLVAWMAGLGPGIFAVCLSAASGIYLVGPGKSPALALPLNANGLMLFIALGVAMSGMADLYRRHGERLREF